MGGKDEYLRVLNIVDHAIEPTRDAPRSRRTVAIAEKARVMASQFESEAEEAFALPERPGLAPTSSLICRLAVARLVCGSAQKGVHGTPQVQLCVAPVLCRLLIARCISDQERSYST